MCEILIPDHTYSYWYWFNHVYCHSYNKCWYSYFAFSKFCWHKLKYNHN